MAEIIPIPVNGPNPANGPVRSETEDGILRLTLANPPANALSLAVIAALRQAIDGAADDPGRAGHRHCVGLDAVFGRP